MLAELAASAKEEDAFWETGTCSGTMYCGEHEHYRFLAEAFGRFAHVNALQRDMCPSMTKFEGEIMVSLGWEGYLRYARQIFQTSFAMQEAVRSHPELRILGRPAFLFSFTSDEFDVYHVNDLMRSRGWRFNGQQYTNALHMAVTRPQTRPGVARAFAADLSDAVAYARQHAGEPARSSAIYGGVPGGMTDEADEFIRAVMAGMMDEQQAVP